MVIIGWIAVAAVSGFLAFYASVALTLVLTNGGLEVVYPALFAGLAAAVIAVSAVLYMSPIRIALG